MRTCKKELVELAKSIHSAELRKALLVSCRVYNTCKESLLERMPIQDMTQVEVLGPMAECLSAALQNTSSIFYTDLKSSEEFRRSSVKCVMCAQKMGRTVSVKPQVLDDAVAFGVKAILTYGWT
ncbi:uncharacterized protein LOC142563834 isoform X2 [Dermacentor variabilis]